MHDDVGRARGDDQIAEGQDVPEGAQRQDVAQSGETVVGLLETPSTPQLLGVEPDPHRRGCPHGHGAVDPDHQGVQSEPDGDDADTHQVGVEEQEADQRREREQHDRGVAPPGQLQQRPDDQQGPAPHGMGAHVAQPSARRVPDGDADRDGHQRVLHVRRRYRPLRPDFWTLRCGYRT